MYFDETIFLFLVGVSSIRFCPFISFRIDVVVIVIQSDTICSVRVDATFALYALLITWARRLVIHVVTHFSWPLLRQSETRRTFKHFCFPDE